MVPVLVFDIETIPDVAGLRNLNGLPDDLSDSEVAELAFQQRRAQSGSDFLPHYLQRVVTISCAFRSDAGFKVFSLSAPGLDEGAIIQRFFDGLERLTPTLVSWNGGGFDLPVLHYRGMINRVSAPRYWDQGEGGFNDSREFKWSNYVSRYHNRHTDLMDLLALYQPRASAPLDAMAKLMGFPGKVGMAGNLVWPSWQAGEFDKIRDYCETDVVNTYLVYNRFRLMRGDLNHDQVQIEEDLVRSTLKGLSGNQWVEFLSEWP